MTEGSGTSPTGSHDMRDHLGYAISEIGAGIIDGHGVFHDQVSHAPGHDQTITYASSTDPWHRSVDQDRKVEQPGIDFLERCGITRGLPVMLAVPVLYDTPENASALAKYVHGRQLAVARYELGEEPDGQRIDPRDFGVLYAQTARAVRKIDPDAVMGGPSFVTGDVSLYFGMKHPWWIREFRRELEHLGERNFFQFLSFEWYPFDDVDVSATQQLPVASGMLEQAVSQLRHEHLPLVIGEFNYSAFSCQQEVDLSGALLNAEIAAQSLCAGIETAYYYGYEPNKLEQDSGLWGNEMMLMQGKEGKRAVPLATFQSLRMLSHDWIDPRGGSHKAFHVRINPRQYGKNSFSAYALCLPDKTFSLLLINKSPDQAVRLTLKNSDRRALFSNSCKLVSYSCKEYVWFANGHKGHPIKNKPPSGRMVSGMEPIIIPAWSIAVLQSRTSISED